MARIRLLPDEELNEGQLAAVAAMEGAGRDSSVVRGLAHLPEMFERYNAFYFPAHQGGLIEPALKELVRLKVARLNDCFT